MGRELLGFIWAIGVQAERNSKRAHKQEAKKQSIPGGEKNERAKIMEVGVAVEQHGKGESSLLLCDRPCGRTRVTSVGTPDGSRLCGSTREYQTDQPSKKLSRSLPALPSKQTTHNPTSTPTAHMPQIKITVHSISGGSRWRLRWTRCAMGFERQRGSEGGLGRAAKRGGNAARIGGMVLKMSQSVCGEWPKRWWRGGGHTSALACRGTSQGR